MLLQRSSVSCQGLGVSRRAFLGLPSGYTWRNTTVRHVQKGSKTIPAATSKQRPPPVRTDVFKSSGGVGLGGATTTYVYPHRINIYDSGLAPQIFMGGTRLISMAVFALGTAVYAPACYMDVSVPWWMAPLAVIGSTIPLVTCVFGFGPYVHHVFVNLPSGARRSREALLRFASDPPPSTRLTFSTQRLIPWPVMRSVDFEDLRRLPSARFRLANLEWMPPTARQRQVAGLGGWLIRQYYGRLFVRRDQPKDRSVAPGVWDRMWKRIPIIEAAKREKER